MYKPFLESTPLVSAPDELEDMEPLPSYSLQSNSIPCNSSNQWPNELSTHVVNDNKLWVLNDGSQGHVQIECMVGEFINHSSTITLKVSFLRDSLTRKWPRYIDISLMCIPFTNMIVEQVLPQTQKHDCNLVSWNTCIISAVQMTNQLPNEAKWRILMGNDNGNTKKLKVSSELTLQSKIRIVGIPAVLEINVAECERLGFWRTVKNVPEHITWAPIHVVI